MIVRSAHPRTAAFTAVEMMMGLVITSLVMSAVAAFMLSLTQAWKQNDPSQSLEMPAGQVSARMQAMFREAKYVGMVRGGSVAGTASPAAAIMLWAADTNGDNLIQFSEIVLVEHNTTTKRLMIYQASLPSPSNDWQASKTFFDALTPDAFKVLQYVGSRKMSNNVQGAKFYVQGATSTSQRPVMEFTVRFSKTVNTSTRTYDEYGTATMRGRSTPTS